MPSGKRLHISPLSPQLLPIVLPEPLLARASNISFHTIQTFPEKSYGFVELPDVDADKLRKKLNGATLKGSKMRVDEARPEKRSKRSHVELQEAEDIAAPEKTTRKKRVREEGVLPGHELQDRKVKRGWTDPSSEKKPGKHHKSRVHRKATAKSPSVSGGTECLFKTTLPTNASKPVESKDGKVKKKKGGDSTHKVVVHEFENTVKHLNFIRDESEVKKAKLTVEYVEGQGWVDEDRQVVDAGPKRRKLKSKDDKKEQIASGGISEIGSRRSSRLETPSVQVTAPKTVKASGTIADDETSSSGTSDSDNQSDSNLARDSPPLSNSHAYRGKRRKRELGRNDYTKVDIDRVERLSITRSSATPPPPRESPPTSMPPANEVHPLEALFKRPSTAASHTPKKPNLEVSTSFSFFDSGNGEGESQSLVAPQTPFTQQDIRQRRQRSAAPTPDTAAPGKTFGGMWEGTSDISGDEDNIDSDAISSNKDKSATPEGKEEKPESDFSKWFWDHRGENNRAWKRRRREAAKEKRQKENKERKG